MRTSTQVGIVGGGPAGLVLAHLLQLQGIDSVVLEAKSRSYVEARVRAGVLEQGTVDLLDQLGVAERMHRLALQHRGIELGFRRKRHRINLHELTGNAVSIYGQHEVVKDLIAAAEERKVPIMFEVSNVSLDGLDSASPVVRYVHAGESHELRCDYIAGCDGSHGVCLSFIPPGVLRCYERTYPFSWLGILAQAAPSHNELVYMNSERGFALFSMRSPEITRLYLQCGNEENIAGWSDDRIWDELARRFCCADGWRPNQGPVLQKSITAMRSHVIEPMQFGRLFLAGDAAHIVPPTGAKGMNLAVSDVEVLARGLAEFYKTGKMDLLEQYSAICLRRVWKVQRFSWWMTTLLHHMPDANAFDHRRQLAELDYITSSRAAAQSLAENYVGLPRELA